MYVCPFLSAEDNVLPSMADYPEKNDALAGEHVRLGQSSLLSNDPEFDQIHNFNHSQESLVSSPQQMQLVDVEMGVRVPPSLKILIVVSIRIPRSFESIVAAIG